MLESNEENKTMGGGAHPAALAQQLAYAQVRLQEGVVPQARCVCVHETVTSKVMNHVLRFWKR